MTRYVIYSGNFALIEKVSQGLTGTLRGSSYLAQGYAIEFIVNQTKLVAELPLGSLALTDILYCPKSAA